MTEAKVAFKPRRGKMTPRQLGRMIRSPSMPFAAHHYLLTQAGSHNLENVKLVELARDRVSMFCTIILPLREKGAAGSPIRPIAIGAPGQ